MHTYSTDSGERLAVPTELGIVAAFAAWGLQAILGGFGIDFPWWISAPSVLSIYAVAYRIFDSWLWRMKWVRPVARVRVPDLNGEWEGTAQSSFDQYQSVIGVTVHIKQTWREIAIRMEAPKSRSHSEFAGLFCDRTRPVLTYEYLNQPNPDAVGTMETHRGLARLEFWDGTLEGDYYAGRGRKTLGLLYLTRK
jgi:hypothetical protein